jgi:hypothetical protein
MSYDDGVKLAAPLILTACWTSSVTPPPASTPEPAPVKPRRPAMLEPGVGVGSVRLGMQRSETRRLLGTPSVQADPNESFDQYYPRGLSLAFDDEQRVDAIHLFSGERGGYETEPWERFELTAAHGITFDSTFDQVVAGWGPPENKGDLSSAPIPTHWISYPGVSFDFIIANEHLFHVVVSKP